MAESVYHESRSHGNKCKIRWISAVGHCPSCSIGMVSGKPAVAGERTCLHHFKLHDKVTGGRQNKIVIEINCYPFTGGRCYFVCTEVGKRTLVPLTVI